VLSARFCVVHERLADLNADIMRLVRAHFLGDFFKVHGAAEARGEKKAAEHRPEGLIHFFSQIQV
jgi:hypothetical protein